MSAIDNWYTTNGDNTYAIDWPLTRDSVVVEVGAYKGRWAKQIYDKYHCTIHAFEPQPWAFAELIKALENTDIYCYPYGLGTQLGDVQMPMGEFETDACSLLLTGQRQQGTGLIRNIWDVLTEFKIKHIDLMMMNIEGYEYQLLSYMLSEGILDSIDRLCVQWHTFADPNGYHYKSLSRQLIEQGYSIKFSFWPTLEAYERGGI